MVIIIIFIQPPSDLVLTQITFEKKRTNFDYIINIKIAQPAEPKVILSFVDFKLYNPDITLTFLELSNTNNFNTNNQSFTQLSFQSYLNTFQSNYIHKICSQSFQLFQLPIQLQTIYDFIIFMYEKYI